jgi:hypothetical protein
MSRHVSYSTTHLFFSKPDVQTCARTTRGLNAEIKHRLDLVVETTVQASLHCGLRAIISLLVADLIGWLLDTFGALTSSDTAILLVFSRIISVRREHRYPVLV